MVLGADRSKTQAFTTWLARPLARIGLNPNVLTVLSLVLALVSAYFLVTSQWWIALGVGALSGLLDVMDGAVARLRNRVSSFGGYLDSVVDRYVDAIFLFGLGFGLARMEVWLVVAAAVMGAFGTSYARARLLQEGPVPGRAWAQRFERAERLLLLASGVAAQAISDAMALGWDFLFWTLVLFAVAANWTAFQRIRVARRHLAEAAP